MRRVAGEWGVVVRRLAVPLTRGLEGRTLFWKAGIDKQNHNIQMHVGSALRRRTVEPVLTDQLCSP